ncbi:MAG TPA: hypothetical protein VMR75_03760 [Candidatus Saccharimonadales bacterium]|nr:hypothetical protein [Candidatus Saccharimonadales bacterium]
MSDRPPKAAPKATTEKRILNEYESKVLNEERMGKVARAKKGNKNSSHSQMLFMCECDDGGCLEVISISTEEYKNVHRKTNYFIVIPDHVHLDLEKVISSFDNYVLVEKLSVQLPLP